MRRDRIPILVAATLSATLWAYACGDGTTEPPTPPPDPPRPATVTITPATAQLTALGATAQLSAEVRDQNGQVMAGAGVTWTSSATSIATVSGSGLVTAAGNGTATITAAAGGVSGTATVTVAQAIAVVAVSPAADTVVAGDTLRLAAEATDSNGHAVAGAEFAWASGDTAVATVDETGLVTGVGAGEVEITATSAGVAGRTALTVLAPVPTTVAVTPDTVAFTALGQTAQLAAEVRDQAGRVMAGVPVSWSSADTTVAAVDSAGRVTAAGSGTTTIIAASGEASGEAVVTVMQSAGSVVVSPPADTIALGDTLRLVAEAFDENGHRVEGAQFNWSSSDVSVATVDASGLVGGAGEGTAMITATAGDALGTSEITVENPDRAALVALYHATDGPNWKRSDNWLTDAPLREWHGIGSEWHEGGERVDRLLLGNNGLSGVLPAVIGQLDRLTHLHLQDQGINRGLSGPIPVSIGKLRRLETLNLTENALSGSIPASIGALNRLRHLHLQDNDLSGPIPPEIGNLAALETLRLLYNDLSGPIPPEIGNLAALETLLLDANNLTGPIPPELGNLATLETLRLDANSLTGPIPPELGGLANLRTLDLRSNNLTGPIPPEIGNLAALETLRLRYNDLSGPIPPEIGNLANLTVLWLSNNDLTGPIPPVLGSLANLEFLSLSWNVLTEPLPRSLLDLTKLTRFYFHENEGLCAPGIASFGDWLGAMEASEGSFCNESDTGVLASLFEAAGGPGWTNAGGWLGGPALAGWHGVRADSLGRVTALDLSRNGLTGRLPGSLGELAHMTELRIADNSDLSGRLPLSLAGLSLRALHYAGTDLCAPVNTPYRDWLSAIPSHEGTGAECAPLSDREVLEAFYDATGGLDWTHNENWLTDAPLGEWYGVEVDDQGVVRLGFVANRLTGRIPPELGGLANLQSLFLYRDNLTGPIPPELGNLANLRSLSLGENDLTGPIPPELGSLANLHSLSLHENDLTGTIPPELGNLADLGALNLAANGLTGRIPPELGGLGDLLTLYLARNDLTGPIPPELGGLANLRWLNLAANGLTGRIPPELGGLGDLSVLYLGENELAGAVPSELGGLMSLRNLALQTNADMSGALPASLTNLAALETLQTEGTGLCAPSDAGFLEWLEGVANRRVALCEGEPAMAYLVQAVQSREFPVPLVAGEEAMLRVFVTAGRDNDEPRPRVRASFFLNGALAHVADIPTGAGPIPTVVGEGSLATSANAVVPAEVVRPGLEMVVEVDPDGTLDAGLGVAGRIPETGRAAVDVRAVPVLDLTLVPFLWTEDPDSAILESVDGMAADPEGHELLGLLRTLLPVGGLGVKAHEPVLSSSNDAYDLYGQTRAIRVMEGGTGYYMGTISGSVTGAAGLGGGVQSFSVPNAGVIAHEFGHNFGLPHAPCGGAGNPDPAFPNADGTIGAWGYDFRDGSLVPPSWFDLMGYCDLDWVSDYNFTKALHYRLANEGAPAAAVVASARSLLLWGGADGDGELFLEPAFVVDAPPELPRSGGQYQLAGRTATGRELFALRFDMPETADGDGSSSFAFALPADPAWAGNLASITLSGPTGSATLDADTARPMAILIDPDSGRVRGILGDLPPVAQAARDAAGRSAGPRLDVLFSRGIPDTAAWRR